MTETDLPTVEPLVVVLDHQGRVVQFSQGCQQLTGLDEHQALDRRFDELPFLSSVDSNAWHEHWKARRVLDYPRTYVETWLGRDGQRHRLRWTETVVPDADGEIRHLIRMAEGRPNSGLLLPDGTTGTSTDLLAWKFEKAKKAEEEYHQAKETFFRLMNHELMTPLIPILWHTDLLTNRGLASEQATTSLEALSRGWRDLLRILTNILDFSRLDSDTMTLQTSTISPWDLALSVGKAFGERARDKGLTFRVEAVGPVPRSIVTDKVRLRQVLASIVSNAIKFSDRGTVTVQVRLGVPEPSPTGESVPPLQYIISDEGVGMSADQVARLFLPDDAPERSKAGSGLGLALARRLIDNLRGEIVVESGQGKGSRFIVRVPLAGPDLGQLLGGQTLEPFVMRPQQAEAATSNGKLTGHVLLAEDSRDNQRVISFFLQRLGLTFELVENGQAAMDVALKGDFDLILMDMQMPILDGYEATRRLRAAGCKLPIIALTAYVMAGDAEKCLEAGCTDYLPKPIERSRFQGTIAEHLHNRRREAAGAAFEDEAAPTSTGIEVSRQLVPIRSLHAGDAAFMALVRDYVSGLPNHINDLRTAATQTDIPRVKLITHRLRGSGGMYGYPELSEAAGRIEDDPRTDSASIHAMLDTLNEIVERVRLGVSH